MPKSSRPQSKAAKAAIVNSLNDNSVYVCTCNKVTRKTIEGVIVRGCQTLPKISTATTAGVGQCGGTCQPEIEKILNSYLTTGEFPIRKKTV
jgi:NAD(P)H-nitrite reductase large subunit